MGLARGCYAIGSHLCQLGKELSAALQRAQLGEQRAALHASRSTTASNALARVLGQADQMASTLRQASAVG